MKNVGDKFCEDLQPKNKKPHIDLFVKDLQIFCCHRFCELTVIMPLLLKQGNSVIGS